MGTSKQYKEADEKIKQYFENASKNINPPNNMFSKIESQINKNENGAMNMKKRFLAAKIITVAAVLSFATITCIAASNVHSWVSYSSSDSEITEFPSPELLEEKGGYSPKYVENLNDEFNFKEVSFGQSEAKDEAENTVATNKTIDIYYTKDGAEKGQIMCLNTSKMDESLYSSQDRSTYKKSEYKGITLYYNNDQYKFVPPDYELTEEDKKAMEEGSIQISYGSQEIEYSNVQSITWYEDGIEYILMSMDYNLSEDEMLEMAHNVINQ